VKHLAQELEPWRQDFLNHEQCPEALQPTELVQTFQPMLDAGFMTENMFTRRTADKYLWLPGKISDGDPPGMGGGVSSAAQSRGSAGTARMSPGQPVTIACRLSRHDSAGTGLLTVPKMKAADSRRVCRNDVSRSASRIFQAGWGRNLPGCSIESGGGPARK